jgi:hypothetical protein
MDLGEAFFGYSLVLVLVLFAQDQYASLLNGIWVFVEQ